jgi:cell division protease FtsH
MRRKKVFGRKHMLLALLGLELGILLIARVFWSPPSRVSEPGRTMVPLTDVYQAAVGDARSGRHDTLTLEPGRLLAATSRGLLGAWVDTDSGQVIQQLREQFRDNGVPFDQVSVEYRHVEPGLAERIWSVAPGALILLLMVYVAYQLSRATGRGLSIGRSRARRFRGSSRVTMKDVAGVEEAKQELVEVVDFLKCPEQFSAMGARVPRGVLLVGPPGTGKTLLARAVAGEAGVAFFSVSGAEFVEMFVGVGAARVRDVFKQARRHAPSLLFIDEIDAVGRRRDSSGSGAGDGERDQTLNQILVEMDGFEADTNVVVIAATNRVDILDPALLRPGRFDRRLTVDLPDVRGRQAILEVHAAGKHLDDSVSLATIAKQTPGFSGADLGSLLNEAAILAVRGRRRSVSMSEVDEAVERVVAGPARKSRVMSHKERAITAYHEAGHAIVARCLPSCDSVLKVSIISRGAMGGFTRFAPDEDRSYWSKSDCLDDVACLLGGQAAEELMFGESTTGASNDIERATQIVRSMVCSYGMSSKIGPISFSDGVHYGPRAGLSGPAILSQQTTAAIDQEVQELVAQAQASARDILTEHRAGLERVASRLLDIETLDADTFEAAFLGGQSATSRAIPAESCQRTPQALRP